MAINPQYTTIGKLFSNRYSFFVPKYQRNYAWEEEQVGDFLDDLQKCYDAADTARRQHFFGGTVSVTQQVRGSTRLDLQVVDGQQRLATSVLLMAQVIERYKRLMDDATRNNDSANKDLAERRIHLLEEAYIEFADEEDQAPATLDKLRLSGPDHQFFQDLIRNCSPVVQRESHRRLQDAYVAMDKKLRELVDRQPVIIDKLRALKKIEDVMVEDFSLIHITTDNRTDAYRLFQVLNDRGMSLTEGDLLRATTLELLGDSRWRAQQESAEKLWDQILSGAPTATEAFLRAYYSSVCGKRPSKTTLLDEFLDKFFPKRAIPPQTENEANAIVQTIQEILSETVRFRGLVDGDWPYEADTITTLWARDRLRLLVIELKHTNCIPLLLAACRLSSEEFAKVIRIVERFVFRYKIICSAHMTPLQNAYYAQAVAIRGNPRGFRVSSLQAALHELMPKVPDPLFESALAKQFYSRAGGNKAIKYLLLSVEHYWMWFTRGAQGEPTCIDESVMFDFPNTSLEHIYPQSATGAKKSAVLEPLKHTLGNLTVMGVGPNNIADDNDFSVKKPIFIQSNLQINQFIARNARWSRAEIATWQTKIIDVAKKVFRA